MRHRNVSILICCFLIFGIQSNLLWSQTDSTYLDEDDYYYEDEYIDEEEIIQNRIGLLWSFDFNWSKTASLMNDQMQESFYGMSMGFLYQIDKSKPIFVGIESTFGQYEKAFVEYYDFLEIDEYLFRETAFFQMLDLTAKVRYFPGIKIPNVEPYIDLGVGPRYAYSYTTVYNVDLDESNAFDFGQGDWELAYSLGVGGLINIGQEADGFFLHFGLNYSGGNNTFFYIEKEGITGLEEPFDRYDRKSIPVNLIKLDLGIIGYF